MKNSQLFVKLLSIAALSILCFNQVKAIQFLGYELSTDKVEFFKSREDQEIDLILKVNSVRPIEQIYLNFQRSDGEFINNDINAVDVQKTEIQIFRMKLKIHAWGGDGQYKISLQFSNPSSDLVVRDPIYIKVSGTYSSKVPKIISNEIRSNSILAPNYFRSYIKVDSDAPILKLCLQIKSQTTEELVNCSTYNYSIVDNLYLLTFLYYFNGCSNEGVYTFSIYVVNKQFQKSNTIQFQVDYKNQNLPCIIQEQSLSKNHLFAIPIYLLFVVYMF